MYCCILYRVKQIREGLSPPFTKEIIMKHGMKKKTPKAKKQAATAMAMKKAGKKPKKMKY